MNQKTLINELEGLYVEAMKVLEETESLIPTFRVIGQPYALSSIHHERKFCEIILRSVMCPSLSTAVVILTRVPDTRGEIKKIEPLLYPKQHKAAELTEKHLQNCKSLLITHLERAKQMQDVYY